MHFIDIAPVQLTRTQTVNKLVTHLREAVWLVRNTRDLLIWMLVKTQGLSVPVAISLYIDSYDVSRTMAMRVLQDVQKLIGYSPNALSFSTLLGHCSHFQLSVEEGLGYKCYKIGNTLAYCFRPVTIDGSYVVTVWLVPRIGQWKQSKLCVLEFQGMSALREELKMFGIV